MKNLETKGLKVAGITIFLNFLLSILKLCAGIFDHSMAMISDSIHSFSDILSTVAVIIGLKFSSKGEDQEHPYGHERIESLTSLFLAIFLFITGSYIGYQGIVSLHNETLKTPGIFALISSIISIIGKEIMFWYTRNTAIKIKSNSLMADAWHHRSDALSSVGSMIGIMGSIAGFLWCDFLASIAICFIILKVAWSIGKEAIREILDTSCSREIEFKMCCLILSTPHVSSLDCLKTRIFGNRSYVEVEIGIPKNFSLAKAHQVAHHVHDQIEHDFPEVKHCTVHVNPVF